MVKSTYNKKNNAVVIEFIGTVNKAQVDKSVSELEKIIPANAKGFTVVTDLSGLLQMGLDVQEAVSRSMDLLNTKGAQRVMRIIPDSSKDIGFNILSVFHYSKGVKILTLGSWKEVWERW